MTYEQRLVGAYLIASFTATYFGAPFQSLYFFLLFIFDASMGDAMAVGLSLLHIAVSVFVSANAINRQK